MVLLCTLLLSSIAPGAKLAPILWNGTTKPSIDLGVVILKTTGVDKQVLEDALDREARRLGADAFIFERSTLEVVYKPKTKEGAGLAIAGTIAETVMNTLVSSLFHGSPSNAAAGNAVAPAGAWISRDANAQFATRKGFFRAIRYVTSDDQLDALQSKYIALTDAYLKGQLTVAQYDAQRETLAQ